MPNLLVEIGVEELPVGSLDVIYDELAAKTRQKLVDERIAFADVKVEATPRRMALATACHLRCALGIQGTVIPWRTVGIYGES